MFSFLVRKKLMDQARNKVVFRMEVPAMVRQEGAMFYSSCPTLDVQSQGRSEKEALDNLIEALQLFVETCYEQGALGQVLRDIGLVPSHSDDDGFAHGRTVEVPLALIAQHVANHAH